MDGITNEFLDWDYNTTRCNANPLLDATYPHPCRESRCLICYEEWTENDQMLVHTGTCGMICHKVCLIPWLRNDCKCPWCKQCVRGGNLNHMHPVNADDRQRTRIYARARTFLDRLDEVRIAATNHKHLKFFAHVLDFLVIRIKSGDRLNHMLFGPAPKAIQVEVMTFMQATSILVRTARKWPSRSVIAQVLFHLESASIMIQKIWTTCGQVLTWFDRVSESYLTEAVDEVILHEVNRLKQPGPELLMKIAEEIKLVYGSEEWDNINIIRFPEGATTETSTPQERPRRLVLVDHNLAILSIL